MLRDEVERYDKLLNMGKMKPDCDISIEDSMRYATQFGIPFKERWPLGTNRPEDIYEKESTRRGKIRHAMVLVGWGVTVDG
ncbi:hypothetical protein ACFX19_005731 [Malus domestica]